MEHGTAGGARIHRAARRGRRVLARAPGRPAGRGLWALPAAALGITATLLGGTPAAAGTAPAVLSILSGPYRVRAAGQAWRLTLLVNDAPGSGASILATLTHRSPGGYEEHEWGVGRLPAASVTAISRGWRIRPAARSVAPVFVVRLTFTITSRKALRCSQGSRTEYSGTLAGRSG